MAMAPSISASLTAAQLQIYIKSPSKTIKPKNHNTDNNYQYHVIVNESKWLDLCTYTVGNNGKLILQKQMRRLDVALSKH